ncbi:MAG: hypothetical protein KGL39_55610 [Patescibacteria group bacterium]|nr:hypothetical protein [Patescibacteria group bacterium]
MKSKKRLTPATPAPFKCPHCQAEIKDYLLTHYVGQLYGSRQKKHGGGRPPMPIEQIRGIRARHHQQTAAQTAEEFGVAERTVYAIWYNTGVYGKRHDPEDKNCPCPSCKRKTRARS